MASVEACGLGGWIRFYSGPDRVQLVSFSLLRSLVMNVKSKRFTSFVLCECSPL
jgi:hypothetical protein